MIDTFGLLKDIAPTQLIWQAFALYYDIHNMKLVAKERFSGKRLDKLAISFGSYSLPTIRSAAVRESDNILGNETLTAGFFEALKAREMYDIDFILDKTYFRTLRMLVNELGVGGIIDFVIEKTDLFNISAFFQFWAAWRPKGYFLKAFSEQGSMSLEAWQPYIDREPGELEQFPLWQKYHPIWETAESRRQLFEELDVLIDNYLIEKTKACKLMAFGIEPICAYFFNKFMEIKNVRILLVGKEDNYSTYEIQKRMRIPYEL
jgi:V/A-type H+-transporting ATPase subunit C